MKRLVCEMCGSNEIRKDNGVFVCQSCGCQYTLEEARKMMVEGVVEVQGTVSIDNTVDVQGTVQVDNTAYVERYLANARRAKEKEDWEEVEKYYNMVEQNDPDNIEAIFYSAYGKAMQSLIDGDIYKRQTAFRVFVNCISVIDDHYQTDRWKENKESITQMAQDLYRMIGSSYVYNKKINGYGQTVFTDSGKTIALFKDVLVAFKESIDNIKQVDPRRYLYVTAADLYEAAGHNDWPAGSSIPTLLSHWAAKEVESLIDLMKIDNALYWSINEEERLNLETQLKTLRTSIYGIENQIEKLPASIEVNELEIQLSSMKEHLERLGPFKRRERASLTRSIDDVEKRLKVARSKKETEAKDLIAKIAAARKEIKAITTRLYESSVGDSSMLLPIIMKMRPTYSIRYLGEHPEEASLLKRSKQEIASARREKEEAESKLMYSKAYLDKQAIERDEKAIADCARRIDKAQKEIARVQERSDKALLADESVRPLIEKAKLEQGQQDES